MWCGQEGWRDRETDECGEQGTVADSARKHNCVRAGRERWGDRETDEYEEQDAVAGCVRKHNFLCDLEPPLRALEETKRFRECPAHRATVTVSDGHASRLKAGCMQMCCALPV